MSCEELAKEIVRARNEATKRYQDMREDKNYLYPDNIGPDGTTWQSHIDKYNETQGRLRKLLDQFKKGPCNANMITADAWKWATRPAPARPAMKIQPSAIRDAAVVTTVIAAAKIVAQIIVTIVSGGTYSPAF